MTRWTCQTATLAPEVNHERMNERKKKSNGKRNKTKVNFGFGHFYFAWIYIESICAVTYARSAWTNRRQPLNIGGFCCWYFKSCIAKISCEKNSIDYFLTVLFCFVFFTWCNRPAIVGWLSLNTTHTTLNSKNQHNNNNLKDTFDQYTYHRWWKTAKTKNGYCTHIYPRRKQIFDYLMTNVVLVDVFHVPNRHIDSSFCSFVCFCFFDICVDWFVTPH